VIRIGPGSIPMHIDSIVNNQPTVLIAVPSFILRLTAYAKEKNIDLNSSSVKKIICIGEPIRDADNTYNELAQRIMAQWNVSLYSTYASTEKQTAFTECAFHNGSHAHPGLLVFEILDENDQPLPPGEFGELTITTLGVEGMPLIRYKTGDICTYFTEPCPCGMNSYRISQIIGRKQQLIKYKGTTLYPPAINNALNSISEISDYFVQAAKSEIGTDDLQVYIAIKNKNENTAEKIKQALQSSLRVLPDIFYVSIEEIVQMQSLQSDRKLNKFKDNR
jgi:phenylacetate-CoA ligase